MSTATHIYTGDSGTPTRVAIVADMVDVLKVRIVDGGTLPPGVTVTVPARRVEPIEAAEVTA